MRSIVITPKNESELKFVSQLLNKLGISSRVLSEEEKEDIGMLILMNEANRNDLVSEEEVMAKLRS